MFYLPVPNLQQALDHYRDRLGWTELWREGESTAAIGPAGGEVTLMLDVSDDDASMAGPMLTVDSVKDWVEQHGDRVLLAMPPTQIPGGWLASVEDPFGNMTYVIDQSTADQPS